MAFHGVADRPNQRVPIDRVLDQIVFRAAFQRFERQLFIGTPGQDNDRNFGDAVLQRRERLQPVCIGKPQIENHDIDMAGVDQTTRFVEPCDMDDLEIWCAAGQEFGDQTRIALVVFNNQQASCFRGGVRHERGHEDTNKPELVAEG